MKKRLEEKIITNHKFYPTMNTRLFYQKKTLLVEIWI